MSKTVSPKVVSLVFGIFIILFAAGFYIFAWQEPSQIAPGGNVATPLNTGSLPQSKSGSISAPIFYDSQDSNYYLNPDGESNLGTINSPSLKQYRMAECRNECSGECTAQCTAVCPAGYQIVSSCKGGTTEQIANWPSPLAMYTCVMATPGLCEGNACNHSVSSFGSDYFASVVVRLLCESGAPVMSVIGDPCDSGDDCYSGFCYIDADGDRYSPASGTKTCQVDSQLTGTDCNDSSANAYPGNTYSGPADGIDNNCNGQVDECVSTTCTNYGTLCSETYNTSCGSTNCGTPSPGSVCAASCSGTCTRNCYSWSSSGGSCCLSSSCTAYK